MAIEGKGRNESLSRAQQEVVGVVGLLGLQPGDMILDAPCELGERARFFARHGMHVVGMDPDESKVQVAGWNAGELEGVKPYFVKGELGVTGVSWVESQAVISLVSFTDFFDAGKRRDALREVSLALRPAGSFVTYVDPGCYLQMFTSECFDYGFESVQIFTGWDGAVWEKRWRKKVPKEDGRLIFVAKKKGHEEALRAPKEMPVETVEDLPASAQNAVRFGKWR
jgi:hypothetical protein